MNKDDLKKHGITAGVAACTAVVAAVLAVKVSHVNVPSVPVSPNATRTDLPARQAPGPAPIKEKCELAEGFYESIAAVKAKADECDLVVITERPYAMIECGSDRSHALVSRVPRPNARRVVDCSLAKRD